MKRPKKGFGKGRGGGDISRVSPACVRPLCTALLNGTLSKTGGTQGSSENVKSSDKKTFGDAFLFFCENPKVASTETSALISSAAAVVRNRL